MNCTLYRKFRDWRYEQEIRLSVRLDKDAETVDGLHFIDWATT